jgi:primosomal protein N' (replication factor Y)
MRLVSVAVPVPFLGSLTYSVPAHLPLPPIGSRVIVTVGSRTVTGCVIDAPAALPSEPPAGTTHVQHEGSSESQSGAVKDVVEVLDPDGLVPPSVVDLCRWVADYYMCGVGDALGAALPPGSRTAARPMRGRVRRVAFLSAHGASAVRSEGRPAAPDGTALTVRQHAALEALATAPLGLAMSALKERGIQTHTIKRLVVRGLVGIRTEADERDPFDRAALSDVAYDPDRVLSDDQTRAFARLSDMADAARFQVALLRGVTGSGKTEVYLRLARHVCRSGRQVLVLVPEIALTPAVAGLMRAAFGGRVAIQHSALSPGERHDQWHRIRRGDVDVVIGTRSAVFAPLSRVGLIIVDEEHDSSYKQDETPRYHGRDVAVMRGRGDGALVVLGSATPSMETYQNAVTGKYEEITLERRVHGRPLASVRIVNMRDEYAAEGPDVIISRELAAAIDARLAAREQVIVLLNRRGYATAVFCRQCGDTFECPNCSVSLTVHSGAGRRGGATSGRGVARCHYCNYSTRVPGQCRTCAAPYLEQAGFGTEKVEEQLSDRFPQARIGRVDRDSVRRQGALAALLSRFAAGELDVLVGTQMVAKGHDFPRVTLVGVISADVGLGMADFRAAERTFQLLTQVAGRAGRGDRPGEAIVQTLFPEHYSIRLACAQDYLDFFEKELRYRRSMRYPPLVGLINVVVRGRTFDEAFSAATDLAARLQAATSADALVVLGPAPAPLLRLKGEHRVQFFVKGSRRGEMRRAVASALAQMPELRRRVTVDVDPLNLL